jgi:hypothetical protein
LVKLLAKFTSKLVLLPMLSVPLLVKFPAVVKFAPPLILLPAPQPHQNALPLRQKFEIQLARFEARSSK